MKPYDPLDSQPVYNVNSAALIKHRSKAREGLATLTREERQAYGAAVSTAVLASQAAQCRRHCEPDHKSPSASGTWHNDGAEIHKAVAAQQRAALLACPGQIRRARTPDQWRAMYQDAMDAKRAARWLLRYRRLSLLDCPDHPSNLEG